MNRYFLKPLIGGFEEKEVTEAEFIQAEKNAGFRSKFGPNAVATSGFSGNDMKGRIEYGPDAGKDIIERFKRGDAI